MSTYKISVVIPVYLANTELKKMTYDCLEGLYEIRHDLHEVIVVDDGSPLKIEGTWFTVVVRPENGGYAKAVNSGLTKASGDLIIVCNNDIEFIQPDWLRHLLKPIREGYGISTIRTSDSDGWSTDDYISEGDKFGSIWAITREAFEELGLLDDTFGKGYFEDLDYWRRAKDAGIKVAKNHAGLVEHKGQASFKTLGTEADTIYNLAMLKYKEKWGDKAYLLPKDGSFVIEDEYDLKNKPHHEQEYIRRNQVSLEEVKRAWGLE